MEISKAVLKMKLLIIFFITLHFLSFQKKGWTDHSFQSFFSPAGQILFLIQQGEHELALKMYQSAFKETGQHDYDLLHQVGIRILDYGFRQHDPECQLLALFGASVSAHEDVYYILEDSLKNLHPEIQLIALNALAHFQNDRADQAMLRAIGSPFLEVRYEAIHQLCKKKHSQAVDQAESLMYKLPSVFLPAFPSLFAMVGDRHSTKILRKLLSHSSKTVRLAVIASIAKYERDDLLPQVRQQALQNHFSQQEACAYTLGHLKDEEAIPKLEHLTHSQYPTVALAAHLALYQLGHETSIQAIEKAAKNEDLFAISALGSVSDRPKVLLELLEKKNEQLHFNALIALLNQNFPCSFDHIEELLVRDKHDLAFTSYHSPGLAFNAWKITHSANQLLKDDISAYQEHLEFKESILEKMCEISPERFISLANRIFTKQQNDLIPHTVKLLEKLQTTEAIDCLKKHQQQLGAPLVRHYCNLALYKLQEKGPYGDQLRQWVKNECQNQFIRFKPFVPWIWDEHSFSLTPEETSQLLIEAFESFAEQQDKEGIETLIEAIATGHAKNRYALAGLLLRATQ